MDLGNANSNIIKKFNIYYHNTSKLTIYNTSKRLIGVRLRGGTVTVVFPPLSRFDLPLSFGQHGLVTLVLFVAMRALLEVVDEVGALCLALLEAVGLQAVDDLHFDLGAPPVPLVAHEGTRQVG